MCPSANFVLLDRPVESYGFPKDLDILYIYPTGNLLKSPWIQYYVKDITKKPITRFKMWMPFFGARMIRNLARQGF